MKRLLLPLLILATAGCVRPAPRQFASPIDVHRPGYAPAYPPYEPDIAPPADTLPPRDDDGSEDLTPVPSESVMRGYPADQPPDRDFRGYPADQLPDQEFRGYPSNVYWPGYAAYRR